MKLRKHYSVAIHPSDEVIGFVKKLKDILADNIGWYHSRNAKAHITIIQFEADERELISIKSFLTKFCAAKSPFHISLDGIKNYLNGALFIAPDEKSKLTTMGFMKQLQKNFPKKSIFSSRDPHLSIARQLDKQNIKIANYLFQEVKAEFECERIVLRELDEQQGQFVIIDEFLLNGNEDFSTDSGQLSLSF